MALVNYTSGEKFLVQLGDGNATVETFTHNALINTARNLTVSMNTEADTVVDLANMSAPAQTVRFATSLDTKIDGTGKLDSNSTAYWLNWMNSGQPKNIRYKQVSNVITNANAVGGITVEGSFLCTNFQITSETQKIVTASITLEQAGAVKFTQNT